MYVVSFEVPIMIMQRKKSFHLSDNVEKTGFSPHPQYTEVDE